MDDILREVIVIDDDDDDDNEDGKQERPALLHDRSERDSSLEVIPAEAMQTRAIVNGSVDQNGFTGRSQSREPGDNNRTSNLGRRSLSPQRRSRIDQNRLDRMEQERHRRYEEAVDRRRRYPDPILIADETVDSTACDRAAGKALTYASLRTQESYGMESRDRMAEAVDFRNVQPMRPADHRLLPRWTRQEPSEQVSPSNRLRKREVA